MKERSLSDETFVIPHLHKDQMNGHKASVHEEKKPLKSPPCDASFALKGTLKKRFTSVHKEKHLHIL